MIRGARRALLALVAGLLCAPLPSPTLAGPDKPSGKSRRGVTLAEQPLRLTLAPTVHVDAIRPVELLDGPGVQAVAFRGDRVPAAGINLQLSRTLPRLWRLRLPRGQGPGEFDVSYELLGPDGRRDRLSPVANPDSAIRVFLEPLRATPRRDVDGRTVLEGGVILHMDVRDARLAGEYRGTLVVSIQRP